MEYLSKMKDALNGKTAKILYVSHPQKECGVYQFGYRIGQALQRSAAFRFIYVECADEHELCQAVTETKPAAIIYNYHRSTLSWLNINTTRQFRCPQLGTIHEITQSLADSADNTLFNYHIAPDPTLLLKNPIVFKTGRLVTAYHNKFPLPTTSTIGSFGFGTDGKGVEGIPAIVQDSYENAIIRLHLPHAKFSDADGSKARAIVARCSSILYKPGIKLEVSHDFLEEDRLLDFLAQNTINVFLYNRSVGRGISSAIDYALAVQRPIAIRRTSMFRHIWDARPSICIEDQPLEKIIANGPRPLERFAREWSEPNLRWDYERIVRKVLAQDPPPLQVPIPRRSLARRVLSRVKREVFPKPTIVTSKPSWIDKTDITVDTSSWGISECYEPVHLNGKAVFNRILDNEARTVYRPTIAKLFKLVPDLMARKIPEANVQQAFTLDTVVRFAKDISYDSKILCVGSFEDSALWGLRRLNFQVDDVDPVLNFELGEFMQRPTTVPASYDIIFSVSVIEHVQDDAEFLIQIGQLLKPGGIAILTCDYNDQYVVGAPKPSVDWRLYTQNDFRTRLLPRIPDCELMDLPRWDCLKPDFRWEGCAYTFASLVFRKK